MRSAWSGSEASSDDSRQWRQSVAHPDARDDTALDEHGDACTTRLGERGSRSLKAHSAEDCQKCGSNWKTATSIEVAVFVWQVAATDYCTGFSVVPYLALMTAMISLAIRMCAAAEG